MKVQKNSEAVEDHPDFNSCSYSLTFEPGNADDEGRELLNLLDKLIAEHRDCRFQIVIENYDPPTSFEIENLHDASAFYDGVCIGMDLQRLAKGK